MSSAAKPDIHPGNTRVLPWPWQPRAQLSVSSAQFLTKIEPGSSALCEIAGGWWLQSDLEQRLGTAAKFSGVALGVMGLGAFLSGFIPGPAVLVGATLLDAILFAALIPLLRRDGRSLPQATARRDRRTLQADLLLQTLAHLTDLPGAVPRLGFDSPSEPTWSLCVEYGHVGRVWVDVLDGGTITFSLAIWHEAPASEESVQAALDQAQAQGGFDALGLRGRTLKVHTQHLPIWGFPPRPMLLMVDVALNPDAEARASALRFGEPVAGGEHLQLQPAPAELHTDAAVAFGRLVRLLTLTSLPQLDAARAQQRAPSWTKPALRVRDARGDAPVTRGAEGDRTWPLHDHGDLSVAAIDVRPLFDPASTEWTSLGVTVIALLIAAAPPAIYAALTDEIGVYSILWAISILGSGIAMFFAERPLRTRLPTLRPRGVPTPPRTLRLEGRRLTLDDASIDLDAPFTLQLTRGAQAENAKLDEYGTPVAATLTELGLRIVQQGAGGVQRISLRAAGLALDEQAARLDVLVLDAPRLVAAALRDDLWPVLRDAAAAHGRAPALDLVDAAAASAQAP